MKSCSRCNVSKFESEFYTSSNGRPRNPCKKCHFESNKIAYKAKRPKCPTCSNLMDARARYCKDCIHTQKSEYSDDLLLSECIYPSLKSGKYTYIRYYARKKAVELGWNKCSKCGYDKHYEVCHIKGIKDFPLTATIGEVNHPSNLIPLCPNCHWEMDNLSASPET